MPIFIPLSMWQNLVFLAAFAGFIGGYASIEIFDQLLVGLMIMLFTFFCMTVHLIYFSFRRYHKLDIVFVLMYFFSTIAMYAIFYIIVGGLIENDGRHTEVKQLSEALYFSVITWTTLGYGDITPTGDARWLAMSEALYGWFTSALLVSLIVGRMQRERRGRWRQED